MIAWIDVSFQIGQKKPEYITIIKSMSHNPAIQMGAFHIQMMMPHLSEEEALQISHEIYAQKMQQMLDIKKAESDLNLSFDGIQKVSEPPEGTDEQGFKVNLPNTKEGYENGNGEGCWALPFTPEDWRKYEENTKGETIQFVLNNNSVYFEELEAYSVLEAELRGEDKRPILNIHKYIVKTADTTETSTQPEDG